jgi:hypothetical protein
MSDKHKARRWTYQFLNRSLNSIALGSSSRNVSSGINGEAVYPPFSSWVGVSGRRREGIGSRDMLWSLWVCLAVRARSLEEPDPEPGPDPDDAELDPEIELDSPIAPFSFSSRSS